MLSRSAVGWRCCRTSRPTPYKGVGPAVTDLPGTQVSSAILDTASLRPLAQAGKVNLLATTGPKRFAVIAPVPTFVELGYPGFEPLGFLTMLPPAGTPRELVRELGEGIEQPGRSDDIRTKMLGLGQEPVGSAPAKLAQAIRDDGEAFTGAFVRPVDAVAGPECCGGPDPPVRRPGPRSLMTATRGPPTPVDCAGRRHGSGLGPWRMRSAVPSR